MTKAAFLHANKKANFIRYFVVIAVTLTPANKTVYYFGFVKRIVHIPISSSLQKNAMCFKFNIHYTSHAKAVNHENCGIFFLRILPWTVFFIIEANPYDCRLNESA